MPGTLFGWGLNNAGNLGNGTTADVLVPTKLGSDETWSSVACGVEHTAAVKQEGTLYTWGNNDYGQLGDFTTTDRYSPSLVSGTGWAFVACGNYHTLAIKDDGSLWGWGDNAAGQVGNGETTGGEGGPPGQTHPVRVGTDNDWVKVVGGNEHTLAIKDDGSLWGWGGNGSGQLANDSGVNQLTPAQIGADTWIDVAAYSNGSAGVKSDGTLWEWGSIDSAGSDPVLLGSGFLACSIGQYLGLGIKTDGTLWAWGRSHCGAYYTGLEQVDGEWVTASTGFEHSIGVQVDGTIVSWGESPNGEVGYPGSTCGPMYDIGDGFSLVSAGANHSFAIKSVIGGVPSLFWEGHVNCLEHRYG